MMMPNYPGIPPISRPSQKCQKTWKVCQSVRALQWSFKREICQEHLDLPLPSSDPGPPRHDARVREYLQDSLLRAVPRYDRAETLCTRGGGRYKLFWLKTYQGRLKNAFFTVNLTRVDHCCPYKRVFLCLPNNFSLVYFQNSLSKIPNLLLQYICEFSFFFWDLDYCLKGTWRKRRWSCSTTAPLRLGSSLWPSSPSPTTSTSGAPWCPWLWTSMKGNSRFNISILNI